MTPTATASAHRGNRPTTASANRGNLLIAALPRQDRQRFLAHSETVDMVFGEDLARPGERIRDVYFPTTGFISLITSTDTSSELEVGLIGDEGMLGMALVLDVDISPLRAMVQGSGGALRMDAGRFRTELDGSNAMRELLHRYLYLVMSQLTQTAACMRYHVVEARLARWLLMTGDRARSDRLHLTHEFLAFMMGVRRVGVTRAASALQLAGLIRYTRGSIEILDRPGLEAAACSCYASDNAAYRKLMGRRA